MTMNDVEKPVATFIQDELINDPAIELEAADDLLSTGHVSSLGAMRIVQFIEQRFEIEVPAEDLTIDNFISVQAIASYVESRRSANG